MSIERLESMECIRVVRQVSLFSISTNAFKAVTLTGFNLEVANAASKSGFNTWNHGALYDLIWAVKRVVFRHCRGNSKAPVPKDPFYPDRYRPSGLGDNTNRKRSAPMPDPLLVTAIKLEAPPKPVKRAFKYKNKKTKALARQGTRIDPIDLVSDEESRGGTAKKQKFSAASASLVKPEANQSRLRAGAPTSMPVNASDDEIIADREDTGTRTATSASTDTAQDHSLEGAANNVQRHASGGAFTQQTSFVPLIDFDFNVDTPTVDSALRRVPLAPQSRAIAAPRSRAKVPIELKVVRSKLDLIAEEVVSCRLTMRSTYNKHTEVLGRDETIEDLQALSKHFETVEEEARRGIQCIDRVKGSLSQT